MAAIRKVLANAEETPKRLYPTVLEVGDNNPASTLNRPAQSGKTRTT